MLNNIKIIYEREQLMLSKRRVFPIVFTFITVVIALFTLIFINRILMTSRTEGSVNYKDILYLYERIWDIIVLAGIAFVVFIASMSINLDKKCNIIDNILTTKIKKSDIVYGKLSNIIFSTIQVVLSAMPMCIMSTFFGGINIVRILTTLLLVLLYLSFFASIVLMISSVVSSEGWSVIVSSILGILFLFANFYFRNEILKNSTYYMAILLVLLILSFLCQIISINSKVFNR